MTSAASNTRPIAPLAAALCLLVASPACQAGPWQVLDESGLSFTGEIEDAPFTGEFEVFSAQVDFDPAMPSAGSLQATVDVRSVDSRNRDRDQYMLSRDFFFARRFPEATFRTTAIRAGDAGFVADGELTLRGETRPVVMRFTFEDGSPARLRGVVELRRLAFGVGQGEWRDTSQIADEVRVSVDLALTPAE
jgi:polyisoprenoid-binding protein YceI